MAQGRSVNAAVSRGPLFGMSLSSAQFAGAAPTRAEASGRGSDVELTGGIEQRVVCAVEVWFS